MTACELRSREPAAEVCLAFPEDRVYRNRVAAVQPALTQLRISLPSNTASSLTSNLLSNMMYESLARIPTVARRFAHDGARLSNDWRLVRFARFIVIVIVAIELFDGREVTFEKTDALDDHQIVIALLAQAVNESLNGVFAVLRTLETEMQRVFNAVAHRNIEANERRMR